MENVMNFKKIDVFGATKEEALANAPFGIQGDATQAWRNARKAHTGVWGEANNKQFMLDYLAKKSKNIPGVGFYITVESAVADTRERPYKMEDVKNEQGARKWKTFYEWIDDATGLTVVKVDSTKADAKAALKACYTGENKKYAENPYKGNAHCRMVKEVVEGQDIVATSTYSPSKNTRNGQYIVFGIANA